MTTFFKKILWSYFCRRKKFYSTAKMKNMDKNIYFAAACGCRD